MNSNQITDFTHLYTSFRKARRNKANSPTALRYGLSVIENTVTLGQELEARTYRPLPTYSFKVYEPKERDVVANAFRDKVVQHLKCESSNELEHFDFFISFLRKGAGIWLKKWATTSGRTSGPRSSGSTAEGRRVVFATDCTLTDGLAARLAEFSLGCDLLLCDGLRFCRMVTRSQGIRQGGRDAPIALPPVPMEEKYVCAWAAAHHELLNGRGYPNHITAEDIPPEVRLLTILTGFMDAYAL